MQTDCPDDDRLAAMRLPTFFYAASEEADNFSVTMKNTLKLSLVLVPLLVTLVIVGPGLMSLTAFAQESGAALSVLD